MRARAVVAALAVVAAGRAAAAEETYVFDHVHSQPGFEAIHMGFSVQRGAFQKSAGKVTIDRAARKGSVDVVIDATSIQTYDARLDNIVKGERFFNVEKFPTITFKSDKVLFDGDNVVEVDGDITMLGITRPLALKVSNFRCGANPFNKKPMCGGEARGMLKRSEFGMTSNLQQLSPADEITLVIPFEAYRDAN